MIAAGLFALGLSGTILIDQEFDPFWFLADGYATDYLDAKEEYFPTDGVPANIYLGMYQI